MRYMLLICSDDKNAPPRPRAATRTDADGNLVLLADQDRSR